MFEQGMTVFLAQPNPDDVVMLTMHWSGPCASHLGANLSDDSMLRPKMVPVWRNTGAFAAYQIAMFRNNAGILTQFGHRVPRQWHTSRDFVAIIPRQTCTP
jgi:hypothetical protein